MIVYVLQIGTKKIFGTTDDFQLLMNKHRNAKVLVKESYKSKKNGLIRLKQLKKKMG